MKSNAGKDGRMTLQRAEAMREFVRRVDATPEDAINKEIIKLKEEIRRPKVSTDAAEALGVELIENVKTRQPNIDRIKELINLGANVDLKDNQDWTPLMISTSYGNREVVELLISGGADASIENRFGNTATAYTNNGEIRKLLEAAAKSGINGNGGQ
jgi:ankyrin repeat protein